MNNDELQVLGTENRKSNNCKWININLSSYFTNTKIDPGAILRGLLLVYCYMILTLTTPLTAVIFSLSGFGVSQTR